MKMLGCFSGRLEIETVSGNVVFYTPILSQLHFNPVLSNGPVLTGLRSKGRVKMNSVSGDLRLSLLKTSSAEFKVKSLSGDISRAIGKVVKEKYGSGQSLNARLGDGKSPVDLTAM